MKLIYILLVLLLSQVATASISKLEAKLERASTNVEMKSISYELEDKYLKEIKKLNQKIEKKLNKKMLTIFKTAQKGWQQYLSAEKDLIHSEFSSEKYGTSAAVISSRKQNQLLKQRYEYLTKMLKSL